MRWFLLLALVLSSNRAFQTQTINSSQRRRQSSSLPSVVDSIVRDPESFDASKESKNNDVRPVSKTPHLIFPGGGLFFYWQAGTVTYLREQGYDMNQITASGASAGSLTATLMAADVDFIEATELALDMAEKAGVWDRSGGLQGIWGPIIREWLDQLLPDNSVELVNHRLSLLVTKIPSFEKDNISTFHDKQDLIDACLASVHLPWFLDGKLTANFRGRPHIDGSFLAKAIDYLPPTTTTDDDQSPQGSSSSTILRLDWSKDPVYQNNEYFDFVKVISKEGIWNILEQGKNHARIMEERGRFKRLPKL